MASLTEVEDNVSNVRHTRKPSRSSSSRLPPGSSHSFALSSRPKGTRTSVSKVRTGCLTCKKRHVKCDETKPSCERCVKWQGYCEGYEEKKTQAKSKIMAATNNGISRREPREQPPNATDCNVIFDKPSDAVFASQLDHNYFAAWKRLSWSLSGGVFPSKLYATHMFQLGQQEPSIRHAIMALGCMTFAFENDFSLESVHRKSRQESLHYKNALVNYGLSMKLLRNAPPGEGSVRNALICSILFAAFEAMNNNRKAMMKHLNHGLSMLRHFVVSSTGQKYQPEAKSPDPHVVGDEVLQILYDMDLHSWLAFLFHPKADPPGPSNAAGSGAVDVSKQIPAPFSDLFKFTCI